MQDMTYISYQATICAMYSMGTNIELQTES